MSIYPFLHPGQCLSYKFPTSVFPARILKCFSGAFTLYENYSSTPEKYKTGGNPDVHPPAFRLFSASFATLSATSFACSLQASLRFLQRVPPVSLHLLFLLFSGFLFLYCTLLFLLPFSLPYKIMHTIPPLLSFTIFCIVSCSFI